MELLQLSEDLEIGHIGPSLEEGRLASVFYFALSAKESLTLDPYNQPAVYLADKNIRIFSLNLPAHGPGLSALDAIAAWADEFAAGRDPLAPFLDKVITAIDALIERGLIIKEKIGLMGLSRGGLIANLIAARYNAKATVCFAPMTELSFAREFENMKDDPQVAKYNLQNYIESLCLETLRFYIGNRDTRVGTGRCFALLEKLADRSFEKGKRSPPVEMMISSSIGHMGHGTSKEVFEAGAHWLGASIGAIHE